MTSTNQKQKQSPHPDLLEKLEWYWLVCADEKLDAAAKVLASRIALYHHNKNTGRCDPSIAALADAVGRVPRAISPSLAALRKHGWITWTTTTGQRNQYRLERVPSRPEAAGSDPAPMQPAADPDDGEGVEGYAADCTPPLKSTTGVPLKNTSYEPVREPGREPVNLSAQERAEADTQTNASGSRMKEPRRPRQRQDHGGTPLPANYDLDEHRSALMVGAGVRQDELREAFDDFVAHALDTGRTSHHWDAALKRWSTNRARRRETEPRQQPEKSKRTSRFQIL